MYPGCVIWHVIDFTESILNNSVRQANAGLKPLTMTIDQILDIIKILMAQAQG